MDYKVGDYVKFVCTRDDFKGVGKIVKSKTKYCNGDFIYLIELPKELHGKGHNGCYYKENNYWNIRDYEILEKVEENMDFTVNDLRGGMIIILRNGTRAFLVETSELFGINNKGSCISIGGYNDDLTSIYYKNLDIMEVWAIHGMDTLESLLELNEDFDTLVWKRKPKELTVAQIEELLGYEIKIVKE
jgi:hypothetical protein